MENFWDYSVWGSINLMSVLLLSLLVANGLKMSVPFLRASLIPAPVLGGGILLILSAIYRSVASASLFDTAFFGGNGSSNLEVLTYHTLALGFIASALKSAKGELNRERIREIFNTGVNTVSTYLLQGICGLAITLVAAKVIAGFFPAAGILLPFGYGQGTGQALNYGGIYEMQYGFAGGKSFGLTIAALGFLSASIGGVIHLNLLKRRGIITVSFQDKPALRSEEIQEENEIPMQGNMDKMTVQLALTVAGYFLSYLFMYALGLLLPGMRSVIFGFNFLLGVLSATLIKAVFNFLTSHSIVKRQYTNNFLLTRISNFFFDIMVVAGIAAIRLSVLRQYWGIILILGLVGLIITYAYNRVTAKVLFPNYPEEQFLTMFGMLTGTASTGVILLREIDSDFRTPAGDNLIYQNFPAIVFGFPMMLLAPLAPQMPVVILGVMCLFFLVMNGVLFRSVLFRRRK